eukprot:TRINITY_DN30382_c0_g2_i1.p1 TRINITY_DN30382_c0_g2~~TRINITY_DN30382_c0_g2_i1.p1  ORF type:complete len:516 (+),score=55.00 TRINITY_DN30382_c0_g2_i1:83-1630(+)
MIAGNAESNVGPSPLLESPGGAAVESQRDGASTRAGGEVDLNAASSSSGPYMRNVVAMFAFQVLGAVAWGIAMGPVFDRYLFYLAGTTPRGPRLIPARGQNSLVGFTESVSGLSSLVLAVPVGLLVDRNPTKRARLLQWSSVFAIAFAAFGVAGFVFDYLLLIYVSLGFLGVFSELTNSASEAIFADSIPAGQRSSLFTTKGILSTVGSATGPLLSAVGLGLIGDVWEPYQMKAVLVVGSLLMPLSCVALLYFRDPPTNCDSKPPAEESPSEAAVGQSTASTVASLSERDAVQLLRFGPLRTKHVPYLLALSDFISCIGAGMTVKFFNLFFIQDEHFSPIEICVLQTAYPLAIAACMKFTQRLSGPLGRAQASLLFFSCNVVCLFLLSAVRSLPVLLAVFLLRGALANSTYPIDRSILMDFTPSSQRGRWNAVQSFTSMTWSGSAVFGGLLADSHDYRFTFLITGFIYATACLMYFPLLALVPRREDSAATQSQESARELTSIAAATPDGVSSPA